MARRVPSPPAREAPLVETRTGSTTTWVIVGCERMTSATTRTMAAEGSMPVLTTVIGMSERTLFSWAATNSAGGMWIDWTPTETRNGR